MLNEFLSHTLQAVIAIDLVGIVAYFILTGTRRRRPDPVRAAPLPAPRDPSLWHRLVRTDRQRACGPKAASPVADSSLDSAFGQLRRVLDGFGSGLA